MRTGVHLTYSPSPQTPASLFFFWRVNHTCMSKQTYFARGDLAFETVCNSSSTADWASASDVLWRDAGSIERLLRAFEGS